MEGGVKRIRSSRYSEVKPELHETASKISKQAGKVCVRFSERS